MAAEEHCGKVTSTSTIHKYKIALGTTFLIKYFLVLNCSKQRVHIELKDAED